ncbi:hypothetical protein F4809DRAFT_601606 [Biscogniauxia mediterranea]|nr:hypothetical protein F4809DRAFT_601606 [Biscogniauxia mediterranea]
MGMGMGMGMGFCMILILNCRSRFCLKAREHKTLTVSYESEPGSWLLGYLLNSSIVCHDRMMVGRSKHGKHGVAK